MHTIGKILKTIREERGLQLRQVAIESNIDLTLLSRVENGKRMPSESLLIKLAETYGLDSNLLVLHLVSDKILEISEQYPDHTIEALKVAQEKARLGERYISFFMNSFISRPIGLESRRYIGNKTKLTDWIMETIRRECPEAHSFCDIFAGTGAVAGKAIPYYDQVIFNDLLCANRVIYQGFFEKGEWNRDKLCTILDEYNHTDYNSLEDNYFSINFGGKYFDYGVSKLIGYVRQNIEDRRGELTDKEYNILLSTLIYNMDRIANTVGHFDAYIQGKEIEKKSLTLRLIDARSYDNVAIYQENSNTLARTLHADIVYMDPPYNSRQYCDAYHLYENLVRWEKPEVKGVAGKFNQKDKKSDFCTMKAVDAFADLVDNLHTRYIVLSYNNMAKKGNGRSNAKMDDTDIMRILEAKGRVQVFSHDHRPFTTGKSNIKNHQERLFICVCDNH